MSKDSEIEMLGEIRGIRVCQFLRHNRSKDGWFYKKLLSDTARRLTTSKFEGSYSITLVRTFYQAFYTTYKFTEMKDILDDKY